MAWFLRLVFRYPIALIAGYFPVIMGVVILQAADHLGYIQSLWQNSPHFIIFTCLALLFSFLGWWCFWGNWFLSLFPILAILGSMGFWDLVAELLKWRGQIEWQDQLFLVGGIVFIQSIAFGSSYLYQLHLYGETELSIVLAIKQNRYRFVVLSILPILAVLGYSMSVDGSRSGIIGSILPIFFIRPLLAAGISVSRRQLERSMEQRPIPDNPGRIGFMLDRKWRYLGLIGFHLMGCVLLVL